MLFRSPNHLRLILNNAKAPLLEFIPLSQLREMRKDPNHCLLYCLFRVFLVAKNRKSLAVIHALVWADQVVKDLPLACKESLDQVGLGFGLDCLLHLHTQTFRESTNDNDSRERKTLQRTRNFARFSSIGSLVTFLRLGNRSKAGGIE